MAIVVVTQGLFTAVTEPFAVVKHYSPVILVNDPPQIQTKAKHVSFCSQFNEE